jgi:hypothetical protein
LRAETEDTVREHRNEELLLLQSHCEQIQEPWMLPGLRSGFQFPNQLESFVLCIKQTMKGRPFFRCKRTITRSRERRQ